MEFNAKDIIKMLGGQNTTNEVSLAELDGDIPEDKVTVNESAKIEIHHPKITRPTISVYEYVGAITKLAKFLYSINDLERYISEVEVVQVINPAELAFKLLDEGKFDAILDRGYERVSFSTLKVRPQWRDMIINYFAQQNKNLHDEMLVPLGIAAK